MSEQVEHSGEHDETPGETSPETTGNEVVDDVLRSMEGVEGRPVGEHVTVFEQAHERLRAVLTGAGDQGGSPRPGPR